MSNIHSNSKNLLWRGNPLKNLTYGLNKKGGRNNSGRICSFRKGGGVKRKYRVIDFNRNLFNVEGIVKRIDYDPNRTSFLALICYKNGIITYILSVEGLSIGDRVINHHFLKINDIVQAAIKTYNGSSFFLKDVPAGLLVNNLELKPGAGSCFCRAAGAFAIVLNKFKLNGFFFVLVRLPSGVEYLLLENCRVVLGIVSNVNKLKKSLGKAGVAVNKGIRPTVRGVAMNPVDHPHGGGEGKKAKPRCAMSPWGKLSKGIKTRKRTITNKYILKKKKI